MNKVKITTGKKQSTKKKNIDWNKINDNRYYNAHSSQMNDTGYKSVKIHNQKYIFESGINLQN